MGAPGTTPGKFIVTVQGRKEWPAKDYPFACEKCANMFFAMCKRDGEYRVSRSFWGPIEPLRESGA